MAVENKTETKLAAPLPFGVQASAETVNWLKSCPDTREFKTLLRQWKWLETRVHCSLCGEPFKRKDLRFDEASTAGNPKKMICQECWRGFEHGTVGNPDYRPPPWPAQLDLAQIPEPLPSGTLIDKATGRVVGRAQGYNSRGHFAEKVTLLALPDHGEGGSIDPDHVVVADAPATEISLLY